MSSRVNERSYTDHSKYPEFLQVSSLSFSKILFELIDSYGIDFQCSLEP